MIKPTIHKEMTNVKFNKLADQNKTLQDVVHPTKYKQEMRVQTVQAPAKQIITQPVHQHFIKHKEVHHIHRPIIKKKYVVKKVKVPTPVIQKIPIVRKVKAWVKTKVLPS